MALVLGAAAGGTSTELAQLFADWRRFEQPPLREGVPDYTATTFARRHGELTSWRKRLDALDSAWAPGPLGPQD